VWSSLIALIGVVMLISVCAFYFRKRRGPGLDPETKALVEAASEARKEWARRQKANDKQTKSVTAELQNLSSQTGGKIASFGGATLYERWIETPQGAGSLIGVKAEAADESTINKRITATRLLTIGVFALAARKKTGGGNVYVVIDGPNVSGVATLAGDKDSNNGPRAFDFAAKVNNAARAAEAFEVQRPQAIANRQAMLQKLRAKEEVRNAADSYRQAVERLPAEHRERFKDVPLV